MPRTRRTQSGAPAQSGPPVAGQTYGAGAQQQILDKSMPKPDLAQASNQQAARQVERQAPGQQVPGVYDPQAAMLAAQQMVNQPNLLTVPSNRPNEPITHGLTRGPGSGPEVLGLQQGSPTGDLFRQLSAELGDPTFAELANRIRA